MLIAENDVRIFNYNDVDKDSAKLGGIQQAEKKLDKIVLEIKAILKKISDLSKILFKQKKIFCTMKAVILITHAM